MKNDFSSLLIAVIGALITALLAINMFMIRDFKNTYVEGINTITDKMNQLESRMFLHFTNDEIHVPRSLTVSKAEFDVYAKFTEKTIDQFNREVTSIKRMIEERRN